MPRAVGIAFLGMVVFRTCFVGAFRHVRYLSVRPAAPSVVRLATGALPRTQLGLGPLVNGGNYDNGNEGEEEEGEDGLEDEEEGNEQREGSIKLKCRQHVNPLAAKYQVPVQLDSDWLEKTFPQPRQPLLIDVGCSKGTWALKYARANPGHNILGLEIRRPVVELALQRKQTWALGNAHFLAVNANIDLKRIISDALARQTEIKMVTVHHPDPHFKNKHKKRRVVNPDFVEELAQLLPRGVLLFVQSDVLECAQDMVETIAENAAFKEEEGNSLVDLENNSAPTDIPTEREIATKNKGLPVYRCLFRRV